jgi:hypothetical protein
VYDNGSTYIGGFRNRKRNGFGIQNSFNGDTYEGYFVNDMRNGFGKYYRFECGRIYEGKFVDNMMDGDGVITTSKGITYKVFNGKKIAA